ncbi:MAG: PEP-CTERM sorting domain-containing protein [Limisphaerales bacterium]
MKKTLIATAVLLAGAVAGYSQGEINFTLGGSTASVKQVIYNQNAANTEVSVTYGVYTVLEQQGSTAAAPETPTGTTVYGGTLLTGTGYDAEMLGAAGFNDSLNNLVPLLNSSGGAAILNFYTGGTPAGSISGSAAVVTGATGGPETIAIAAWNNEGGTITSLAAAQAASDPWGISALANITSIASPSTPANMSTASDLNLSFSLGQSVPEPSTIALGVMGVSALLFRRRK